MTRINDDYEFCNPDALQYNYYHRAFVRGRWRVEVTCYREMPKATRVHVTAHVWYGGEKFASVCSNDIHHVLASPNMRLDDVERYRQYRRRVVQIAIRDARAQMKHVVMNRMRGGGVFEAVIPQRTYTTPRWRSS